MIHAHTCYRWRRGVRLLVLVPAVALAWILPAPPARASCDPNAIGIAHSNGVALIAAPDACPPAYGQPAGSGTGRKVG
jgi:hypothetical protein